MGHTQGHGSEKVSKPLPHFMLGGLLMAALLFLVLGAAAPAPIQRNQWTTNVAGVFVQGDVGFTNLSAVNGWITIKADGLRAFNKGGLEIVHLFTDNNLSAAEFGAGFAAIFTNGAATFTMKSPNQIGMIIAGAAAQSVDLLRLDDSSGAVLAAIHNNGGIYSSLLAPNRAVVTTAGTNLATATGTQDGTRFLRDDNTYAVPAGSGVSSVGLTVPSNLGGTNSGNVTSTGQIGFTNTFQSANTVFAGPGSGSKAEPAFRALVAADLPTLAETTLAYSASTVTLDFSSTIYQFLIVTNDTTITNLNQAAVKNVVLSMIGNNTNCNLTFPANWQFLGAGAPALLASNKWGVLSLTARGTSPTNIIAAYSAQP